MEAVQKLSAPFSAFPPPHPAEALTDAWWSSFRPAGGMGARRGEDLKKITACKFLGYLILDQILPAANLRKQQSIYAPLSGAESKV